MFRELAPFLRNRAVLLTVAHLGEDQIRVNVVPRKLKDGENEALTTPLSVTGTADELDAELSKTLVDYVGAHLQLKNTLDSAKSQMDTAAKAAQEEVRIKTKSAGKGGKQQSVPQVRPDAQEACPPVEIPKAATAATPSLFDFGADPTPVAGSCSSVSSMRGSTESNSEEEDILAEITDEDSAADDLQG